MLLNVKKILYLCYKCKELEFDDALRQSIPFNNAELTHSHRLIFKRKSMELPGITEAFGNLRGFFFFEK